MKRSESNSRVSIEDADVREVRSRFGGHYEPLALLYQSGGTRVWLVRHEKLGAERILKRIEKTNNAAVEAKVLLQLRHPGIPILYDFEEDEEVICLLEECVRGVTLKDFLAEAKAIPIEEVLRLSVQICEIVEYLHERPPRPILYLDMKPEHIYLRGDQVMLIDYSASLLKPRSGSTIQKYGTKQYAAPEVSESGLVDERSDIYSVAKVIGELLAHTAERVPGKLQRQISLALSEKPGDRPGSMREFRRSLECLQKEEGRQMLRREIAISGNDRSVGCTHIAISLVIYFNAQRLYACYENDTGRSVLQYCLRADQSLREKDGMVTGRLFQGVADFGPPGEGPGTDRIMVRDCGTDIDEARKAQVWIHVVGSRPWQDQQIDPFDLAGADCVFINPNLRSLGRRMAQASENPVLGFPSGDEPFSLSREKRKVFVAMCKKLGITKRGRG